MRVLFTVGFISLRNIVPMRFMSSFMALWTSSQMLRDDRLV